MQVEVSSSARSGSPAAIAPQRLDSTRWTIASAWLVEGVPEGLADDVPEGPLRRGRVFLLTASSYGGPGDNFCARASWPDIRLLLVS
jgi:hypothetical protein